jgi:CDP-glycerol glycerophosphotransferase (TagB/SpsB family)
MKLQYPFLTRRANRRRLLFNARTPMNYAIVAPLHRAMRSDPRVEFYFTASETPQRAAEILRDAGPEARIIKPQRAALIRFDAYVVADRLWMTLPRGAPRVQMFHGVGGKFAHDYDKPTSSMRQWDRLFFVNERRLRNFLQAGAIDADSKAPRLVGMPRVDCLVDGSWNRDEILVRLGLDPGRPTILYAPTWSAASSINRLGEELIRRLLDGPWNVIVKLHDRLRDPREFYSGGLDWGVKLQPMLARANGHLASGADINPYLVAADLMITDHSSVGFEFLVLDRPLVVFDAPGLPAAARINPEKVALLRSAATVVSSAGELAGVVNEELRRPDRLASQRRKVAAEMFHDPGNATDRAVALVRELLDAPLSETALRSPQPAAGGAS